MLNFLRSNGDTRRCVIPWDCRAVRAEFDYFAIDLPPHIRMWKLDAAHMDNTLKLSPDSLTVTKSDEDSHAAVIGDRPLDFGVYRWTVEIRELDSYARWLVIGVVSKSNLALNGDACRVQYGASSCSQMYGMEGSISDWSAGDRVCVEVDTRSGTMSITSGTDTRLTADVSAALAEGDLYPCFILYSGGDELRIVDIV